uniref:Ig-like domain-containing protein n=1 Tax=Globodera rostochiensis TaxID=31243 RepID=A0A914HB74_GLORO
MHVHINAIPNDGGHFQCQLLKPGGKFFVPTLSSLCETELVSEWHKAAENVHRGRQEWENGTTDTYASLALRKIHHNKVISCEAQHPETNTNLRDSITLDVYYSSDRPKIDVIGTTPAGMVALESGQNITLLCTAEGYNPPPQLIWSNQNGRVNEEYSYDMENQLRLPIHSSLMPSQTPCATGENAVQFDLVQGSKEAERNAKFIEWRQLAKHRHTFVGPVNISKFVVRPRMEPPIRAVFKSGGRAELGDSRTPSIDN